MSYPRGDLVNSHTPKHKTSVKYKDLDHAIRLCREVGPGCCVAKTDFKSAFRNLPIRPQDRKWLVMKAQHPRTMKTFYFVDKCLPFGASISCSHFQRVSNAIEAIFRHKAKAKANNYLDDFLLVALLKWLCNYHLDIFLDICTKINFPVAPEKTECSTQIIVFLGMLLDTIRTMYKALMVLAYYGLFRVGELTKRDHPIKVTDLHVGRKKRKMQIILRTSKTHGLGDNLQKVKIESFEQKLSLKESGKELKIPDIDMRDKRYSPYNLVQNYVDIRDGYTNFNEPFFIFRDNKPVSPVHVREVLRKALKAAGLRPELYGTQFSYRSCH